jgi:hypothetical protein
MTAWMFLRDLPITKALNSYSKTVAGKLVLINDGPTGIHDRFCFRFFPISEFHVQKLNTIMLDENHMIDLIVFHNKAATIKTLGKYIASHSVHPFERSRVRAAIKPEQAWKILVAILPAGQDPNLARRFLQGREYNRRQSTCFVLKTQTQRISFPDSVSVGLRINLSPYLNNQDFDQAPWLLYLRIKTDIVSRNLIESKREEPRKDFLREFVYVTSFQHKSSGFMPNIYAS